MKAERSLHQKENSGEYAFFLLEKGDFSFQCGALSSRALIFCLQKQFNLSIPTKLPYKSIIFKKFWFIAATKAFKPTVFACVAYKSYSTYVDLLL